MLTHLLRYDGSLLETQMAGSVVEVVIVVVVLVIIITTMFVTIRKDQF